MSTARTAGVVVVGVLLTATLLAGNVVFAAHQTVLDPDYVSTTIEEEGSYERLVDDHLGAADPALGPTEVGPLPVNGSAVAEAAVTEEYVASQAETNIERLYAYLHGNSDQLALNVATEPVAENAGAAAESQLREAPPGDVAAAAIAGGESGDGPLTGDRVRRLDDGQESYRSAKEAFREDVRDRVVEGMVEEAFATASNDELLSLVVDDYDPDDYTEAEKERMVDERESEIRAALDTRIRDERADEVDDGVEAALTDVRERANASASVEEGNERMADAASALTTTTARALTTEMSYDTYRAEATAARDDLAAGVGAFVETRVSEELDGEMSITDEMPAEQRDAVDTAAVQVQRLDLLAVVLPALALVLVGLVAAVSRSPGRTGGTLGWGMVLAGAPTYFAAGRVESIVTDNAATEGFGSEAVLGLFEGVVGTLQAQSLGLAAVGTLLVVAALALRYDLHRR